MFLFRAFRALPAPVNSNGPTPCNNNWPVLAFAYNLGSIGVTPVSKTLILAYPTIGRIRY